ncbi:MAG: adenylate/guanylate cyclase domain-containing protein, partial [Nitrospirota bacterium]
ELPAEAVQGKIVIIGPAHPGLDDAYAVPFSRHIRRAVEGLGVEATEVGMTKMYGLEIHAHALQMILDGAYLHRSPRNAVILLILGVGAVAAGLMIFGSGGVAKTLIASALLGGGVAGAALWLFSARDYWLDSTPLMGVVLLQAAAGVAYHQVLEARNRRRVTALFGKYVSPGVVQRLIEKPELIRLQGSKERLTIFFSDIRGFTSMSEQMDPIDVTALLNEYFTEMSALVFKYNGTLDKYMGDAIMAFFGNPLPYPDHALRAVRMALEMQSAVARLNDKWRAEGRRTIGVGMGINTGEATVGNLGSELFFDYTIIGDAVNLACRIEQNAGAGQILISRSTYEEVKESIEVVELPAMSVKGKEQLIKVFQVVRQ